MAGLRASLSMMMCLGLLTLAPLSAVSDGNPDERAERAADSAAQQPVPRAKEGGENRPTHKLRGAPKAKKTTPKKSFGTVSASGAKKAAPATDSKDTLDE